MSKTLFFTDPHLYLNRMSHTTSRSRELLRDHLYETVQNIFQGAAELAGPCKAFCLGDLVDEFSNKERGIGQAASVVAHCDLVLGGNHDMQNNALSYGTLELLHDIYAHKSPIVINPDRSQPYVFILKDTPADTWYYCVPHAMSQELFYQSLCHATAAIHTHEGGTKILLLHCNVGDPHDHDVRDKQASLWLTPEIQEQLLPLFDFILVGHEHVPQSLHGGKLLVLGNIYPIAFGEIADRYFYLYDSDTKTIEAVKHVSMDTEFKEYTVEEFMSLEGKIVSSAPLVQISGTIPPTDYPLYSRCLHEFWKTNELLFMVNSNVKQHKPGAVVHDTPSFVPRTMKQVVGESIKGTEFAEAYQNIVESMEEGEGSED